jgi:hypothetical protein
MKKAGKKEIVLWTLIVIPYLLLIPASFWYFKKLGNIEHASFIVINKAEMNLYHYNYKGELLQKSQIATGKNFGNKEKIGDAKTPEGVFNILQVEDASSWTHDFKDDTLGLIQGAYGPFFIRLSVPGQKGIGIHGTHDDNSIGSRASEGCIRMHNKDLVLLVKHISNASVVVITPGLEDVAINVKQRTDTIASKPVPARMPVVKNKLPVKPKKTGKTGLRDRNRQ